MPLALTALLAVIHASYLLAVLGALVLVLAVPALLFPNIASALLNEPRTLLLPAGIYLSIAGLIGIPAACALLRLWRRERLLPPAAIRRQPLLTALITLTGGAANLLMALVIIPLAATGDIPEDGGGPLLFFLFLIYMGYLFALLSGELVLLYREPVSTPAASR